MNAPSDTPHAPAAAARRPHLRPRPRPRLQDRLRTSVDALEHIVGGLGTSVLALGLLCVVAVTALACAVGVGVRWAPVVLRGLRVVADRERARLSAWGPEIVGAEPVPDRLGAALRDPAVRRELGWLLYHAPVGFFLGGLGLTLPLYVVTDLTLPLWWRLLPPDQATDTTGLFTIRSLPDAALVGLSGLGWAVVVVAALPLLARLQAWPGRRLLAPARGTDLALRIATLTATRAAALDAHTAELRRIERSLHDGAQNRLVAVTVLVGAARRALARDPSTAGEALERAQDAAETALAELRAVVRSILPPVLTDRSLTDALTSLVAACPVECRLDADVPGRCAASVEATAYFVVAEALTNVARHSGAHRATVRLALRDGTLAVTVTDDGTGGAREDGGSGLAGMRRRVEAHDGTFCLTSPAGGPTALTVGLPSGR